ncbi:unnamed protein product [Phaeothamnion confervicola]
MKRRLVIAQLLVQTSTCSSVSRQLVTLAPTMTAGGVIFLHGSGDTGPGVRQWLRLASSPPGAGPAASFEGQLAAAGVPCTFPTAPLRPYTLGGGAESNVWFNRRHLALSELPDLAGIAASVSLIEAEARRLEAKGVPLGKIVVGGFSMGGSLALQLLAHPDVVSQFAGVFSLSSFLSSASNVFSLASPPATPIFLGHGLADTLVPAAWGAATAIALREGGFAVSKLQEYGGLEHEFNRQELNDLREWILERITED